MNGYWVATAEKPAETAFYNFIKTFELAGKVSSFEINVSADTRYKLYINGNFVCEGPCQGSRDAHYYESASAAQFLCEGENTVRLYVQHIVGNMFLSEYRGERPAVWFKASLKYENGEEAELVSDKTWKCAKELGVKTHVCKDMHVTMPPNETVLAEGGEQELETEELYRPCLETKCVTMWGDLQKYPLLPRPIPLFSAEAEKPLKISRKGKNYAEFDAEEYTTAYVRVRFKAPKGAQVWVNYAECRTRREYHENGEGEMQKRTVKGMRDDENGFTDGTQYDMLVGTGEWQEHTFFWFRSFRYIQVECAGDLHGAEVFAARYAYPFTAFASGEGKGSFSSNEKYLDDMWKISKNTVECCTHETFVDCPYYEQGQYTMDGLLESLFALRLSNDTAMPKKFIEDLARAQNAEGLVPAKAPFVSEQLIPSFSMFWVMAVREYLRYTGDVAFAKKYTGAIDKAMECFNSFIDGRGLVGETHYWNFIDWVPEWSRNGTIDEGYTTLTVYSMIYAYALADAADVAEKCGRRGLAGEYRARKAALVSAINAHCYDEEKGMYEDVPGRKSFSRHTTIWAVLCGACEGEAARALIERTFAYDDVSLTTFSMNYFTFRALEKTGLYEKYAPAVFADWKKMIDLHCTTWCENPDNPRSECHGWSSTPMYEISAAVLGVYPAEDGFAKVRISPVRVPEGFCAEGRVPVPDGYVDIKVERNCGKMSIFVRASREMALCVKLPFGECENVYAREYSVCAEVENNEG
ncbi:MAG: hypothetical protein IJX27_02065 [Clostridia bacterium]|nr:hypothetical protein [Clostridia bacterium]